MFLKNLVNNYKSTKNPYGITLMHQDTRNLARSFELRGWRGAWTFTCMINWKLNLARGSCYEFSNSDLSVGNG